MGSVLPRTVTDDASGHDGDDGCGNGDDGLPFADPGVPLDEGERGVPLDTVLDLLSKRRCCRTLATLDEVPSDVLELGELVDRVVEREVDAGVADGTEAHRQRVAVALHHRFLPKLSEAAVVDYDARSKTVRYWGDDRVLAYLDSFRDDV